MGRREVWGPLGISHHLQFLLVGREMKVLDGGRTLLGLDLVFFSLNGYETRSGFPGFPKESTYGGLFLNTDI